MKDRIRSLLINGLKASEITQIVGCTSSYISQLLKDPVFKESVEEGMLEAQTTRTEEEHIDKRYETLEHKLLTAAEAAMREASLGEITRAMEVIHKRTALKRGVHLPAPGTGNVTVNVVSLQLPAHALSANNKPQIVINENKEIISIAGRPIAPMSADGVKSLFASRMAAIANQKAVDAELVKEL